MMRSSRSLLLWFMSHKRHLYYSVRSKSLALFIFVPGLQSYIFLIQGTDISAGTTETFEKCRVTFEDTGKTRI